MITNSIKKILVWTLIFLFSFTSFNLFISGQVQVSIEIEAPIDAVYQKVSDLRTWIYWQQKDTARTTKYSGDINGLGSKMSWVGKNESGSLEIIEANFPKYLKNKLIYDGSPPFYSIWTFQKSENGTLVTFKLQDDLPFYVHFMQLFITPQLKESLMNLKVACES